MIFAERPPVEHCSEVKNVPDNHWNLNDTDEREY